MDQADHGRVGAWVLEAAVERVLDRPSRVHPARVVGAVAPTHVVAMPSEQGHGLGGQRPVTLDQVRPAGSERGHRGVGGELLDRDRPDVPRVLGPPEEHGLLGERVGEMYGRFQADPLPVTWRRLDGEPVASVHLHDASRRPSPGQFVGVLPQGRSPVGCRHREHRVGVEGEVQRHRVGSFSRRRDGRHRA